MVNKKIFAGSISNSNLPHPATREIELDSIGSNPSDLKYPLLIKPAVTQDFWRFNAKSFIARNSAEFEEYTEKVAKYGIAIVLQEIVPGPPSNLFGIAGYMDRNFKLKGTFAYRRIRDWPAGFGCNSLIESIPIRIIESTKRSLEDYLRSIKYCGLFEAEFKRDDRDGVLKILEINARGWWQNFFPTVCGLNLVLMAFLDAVGQKFVYSANYKTGLRWIYPINDCRAAMTLLKQGQLRISEWISSYRHIKDFPYLNSGDPLPCLLNPFFVGPIYTKELLRKLGLKSNANRQY